MKSLIRRLKNNKKHLYTESFEGMEDDVGGDVKMGNAIRTSSSSEMLETQEVDDDSGEDSGKDVAQDKQEASHEEEVGEDKQGISLSRSKQVFNYHPRHSLEELEETEKISNKNNSAPALQDDGLEIAEREQADGERITGKGITAQSIYRSTRKQNENHLKFSVAHRMTNAKNKLPYALRADRPHFKYPMNSPVLDSVDTGDSAYETLISSSGYSSKRKKREVSTHNNILLSFYQFHMYLLGNRRAKYHHKICCKDSHLFSISVIRQH